MSTNPMQMQSDGGDPGDDEQGSYQQCEQDIDALQAWAKQVGAKIGIPFTGDTDDSEPDGLSAAIQGNANPFLKAKSL